MIHNEFVALKSILWGNLDAKAATFDFFQLLRKITRATELIMKKIKPVEIGVRTGTSPNLLVAIAVAALND